MVFILKGMNFTSWEQSLYFKNCPPIRKKAKMKTAKLLLLNVYPFTLNYINTDISNYQGKHLDAFLSYLYILAPVFSNYSRTSMAQTLLAP